MHATMDTSDQHPKGLADLAQIPSTNWPLALTTLKESMGISWLGMGRRLGVRRDHISRLRTGKCRAGFVMADRIVGLAIEESKLVEAFGEAQKTGKARTRFNTPLPLSPREKDIRDGS